MTSEISIGEQEKTALLNLLSVEGIGTSTVLKLTERFQTAAAVFDASDVALASVPKMTSTVLARLRAVKPDGDVGKQQFEAAQKSDVSMITFWDDEYPPLLKQIENDAPVVLFVRGKLAADARRLAVVGTRSATAYGKRMTREIILGLRGSGLHIVSGLASGIDGYAHEAALEAGLTTEAIFGCGVDRVYPPMNTMLANRILAAEGALISEYPLGTLPDRYHFPQRNRIIAGLAQATLVTEAGDKSGALITAMLALDYNRDVMAVPGAVNNPKSRGCHALIRNGAALIERAEDILQALELRFKGRKPAASEQMAIALTEPETVIVKALDATEAQHIDDLALKIGVPVGEALGQLLLLELKGIVKQLPGKYFVRA